VPDNWAFKPRFPSGDLLDAARDFLPAQPAWGSAKDSGARTLAELSDQIGPEGPRYRVWFSPGAVGVQRKNLARREKSGEHGRAWATDRMMWVDGVQQLVRTNEHLGGRATTISLQVAIHTAEHEKAGTKPDACDGTCPHWPQKPPPRQEIYEWSSKSHANMWQAMHQIDFHTDARGQRWMRPGRVPAMVTLTYPGDWYALAPTGRHCKRHLRMFLRRYRRAWGEPLIGPWKLEFQRRGAPHIHILTLPPYGRARAGRRAGMTFKTWLSHTWADVCGAQGDEYDRHVRAGTGVDPQEGRRMQDPRKTAVYFSKHSAFRAKWYQNQVPVEWQGPGRGPGRFWGYWGLRRIVHAVELLADDAIAAARLLRRWAHAQGVTRVAKHARTPGGRARSDHSGVIGLAGAQYAESRPVLARDPDGRIVWRDQPVAPTVRLRQSRSRVRRLRSGSGWVSVNQGADFASQLADWLTKRYAQERDQVHADYAQRLRDALFAVALNREHLPSP